MGIEDLQPIPQGPSIRKVPHLPEMPGGIPPGPDVFPELDDVEIGEEGDPTTIKLPDTPMPNIRDEGEPDLDTDEEREIRKIIDRIKKDKEGDDEKELPKKGPGKTYH